MRGREKKERDKKERGRERKRELYIFPTTVSSLSHFLIENQKMRERGNLDKLFDGGEFVKIRVVKTRDC